MAVANVGDLGNVARVRPPLAHALRIRSDRVRRAIEDVVADHPGAVLLDVTPADVAFRDPTVFAADLFHPGPSGHSRWAQAAVPGLRRALARVPSPATGGVPLARASSRRTSATTVPLDR